MEDILWTIVGWICKGVLVLMMISMVGWFVCFLWSMATNCGRKWYYYDSTKPWKGAYWTPLLPDYPPYNEYKWNPHICRYEHKKTGEPFHPWESQQNQEAYSTKTDCRVGREGWMNSGREDQWQKFDGIERSEKKLPEWLRFLLYETPSTLLEKRRQRKRSRKHTQH